MGRSIAAIAAMLVCASLAASAAAEPLTLRIGWAQAPSQLTPLVAELMKRQPQLVRHAGRSYTLQPMFFRGSTPQIQALASGELEIASLGASSLVLGISNAHLDLRIVGDVMQDGVPGYFGTYWAVRKDGPVQNLQDMRGRRAALNALGAMTDIMLRQILRRNGVPDSSYTVIETSFSNMLPMIENDKVDIVPVMPQFDHDFQATDRYRALFTTLEAIGPAQVGMWCMRADVIAANRAALVDFFEDDMRAVRWFLDPANRTAALDIAQAVTKESKESLAYAFTKGDLYRSPDLVPDIKAVQKDIDQAFEMKQLPVRFEASPKYVDLTMIAEAKARIDQK